jgi:acetyl esterase/lipase
MASLVARAVAFFLERQVKPRLAAATTLAEAAAIFESLRPPSFAPGVSVRPATLRGIDGETVVAKHGRPIGTLLYLHGGGYFCCSPRDYRSLTQGFARRGFEVFAPAYRLAPRHPFPVALEDARAAYGALAERGCRPIVVAGDSSGGGLALALMIRLRDEGAQLPKAAALFSPWTDLAVTGASARANEQTDALFTRKMLKIAARAYLGDASAKNPLASPLYADLTGLPPLLVHVGEDEILRDDSTRLAERAQAAGVSVTLELWDGVPHGWQLGAPFIPEARASLDKAAAFLRGRAET